MTSWENSPYRCEVCGNGVDRDSPGTARRVTGWLKNGSSAVRHAGPAQAWAHWVCVESKAPAELPASLF